jgi:FkbM family methyltransferase
VLQGPLRGARWIAAAHTNGCWLGTYELPKQRAFVRLARRGDTVWDIGANAGFYTLLASRLVGPGGAVVALEPLPRNVGYLRRHIAANRCGNVQIIEAAALDDEGHARMAASAPATARVTAAGDIVVRMTTLDTLVFRDGLPAPHLIKIDVEGAEAAVLKGAWGVLGRYRPTILLSTHSEELRHECHAVLRRLGYVLTLEMGGEHIEASDEVIASPAV